MIEGDIFQSPFCFVRPGLGIVHDGSVPANKDP